MANVGLYLFRQDLRLSDNPLLLQACRECDTLVCCYVTEKAYNNEVTINDASISQQRFKQQTLNDLACNLENHQQALIVINANTIDSLSSIIDSLSITHFYTAQSVGSYEYNALQNLQDKYPNLQFHSQITHTLFKQTTLPFQLSALPNSFTKFRKKIEASDIDLKSAQIFIQDQPTTMPLPPQVLPTWFNNQGNADLYRFSTTVMTNHTQECDFIGGERAGLTHLVNYFSKRSASKYKQTRNALSGWEDSTKFSPWLAWGCISPRQIMQALNHYEQQHGANESTYWIYFELLWREYFQWYGFKFKSRLFYQRGTSNVAAQYTGQDTNTFERWCHGETAFPIVNACMKQLNATGYMSNRGRQLVASCLIYELKLDWRMGADYFQQQLIDHDIASNWGNWQYIACVGCSPNGTRRFDLDKQTQMYDRNHTFIQQWDKD